jgi:hypothetical protein
MRRAIWIGAALLSAAAGGAQAADPAPPRTLEDCYLNVAMTKSTADLAYVARELCDAVFGRTPRALSFLDPKSGECTEWWFDEKGRFESADRLCSLEDAGEGTWKLACQWKRTAAPSGYTFARLRAEGGRLVPVGKVHGREVGAIFSSLGACVEHRAAGGGGGG